MPPPRRPISLARRLPDHFNHGVAHAGDDARSGIAGQRIAGEQHRDLRLLAGRPPFAGATPLSVVHDHVYAPPPPIGSQARNLPPDLEAAWAEWIKGVQKVDERAKTLLRAAFEAGADAAARSASQGRH